MSDNPYRPESTPQPAFGPSPEQIKSRVFAPAIALIVSGALTLMGAVWGVISWSLAAAGVFPTEEQKAEQAEQLEEGLAEYPEILEAFQSFQELQGSPIILVSNLLGLVLAVVVILGGLNLMNVRGYATVLAAAIINMIPLFTCCCYGLPIGIWVLVVIMSNDVKAAFRSASSPV